MTESDYFSSDDEAARSSISAPADHRVKAPLPQGEGRAPRATRSFAALHNAYVDTGAGPEEAMPAASADASKPKSKLSPTAPPQTPAS